jgi:hypothetical protein
MFHVFFASVLDVCFICLQKYVASVVSGYFKSRSGVASPCSCFLLRIDVSSSPSAAVHPSQIAEGAVEGACHGLVARM